MGYGLAMAGVLTSVVWAQTPVSETVASAMPPWTPIATPAAAPAVTKFFPLSEVRRGMKGVAYTVFEGVTPEPMQVEILGVLRDALGPGQDMILARLHGDKPEYTGVVAGMSGSPVYIDGRLLGALSYRIGQFSKEPIAGITPIEQMLEVRDLPERHGLMLAQGGQNQASLSNGNTTGAAGGLTDSGYTFAAMETPLM